jgi:N6-adenosine-specific RNA methylase IME4
MLKSMLTSILYTNSSGTTTLLDLPTSIQNGQYLRYQEPIPPVYRILSARAPEQAYPNIEPKGLKRARLLCSIPHAEQDYHQSLQAIIAASLQEIGSAIGQRQWLLPRQPLLSSDEQPMQMSRTDKVDKVDKVPSEPHTVLSSILNIFPSLEDIADRLVCNPSDLSTTLVVGSHAYHIPPRSKFILSDVARFGHVPAAFSQSLGPRCFDFIIMDPPWPNRSVRHAKAYKTSESCSKDPFLCVLPVLNDHLRSDGYVGIWVTNKATIRHKAILSLDQQGFQLCEEWIWIKTTVDGDPVTPLDGLWRHPYEVLLLFCRKQRPTCGTALDASEPAIISPLATRVSRHVLVAVPGHHSQKPCLKEFIEPLLKDAADYQALEIFARNLTAGWYSWGDEVLKYNLEAHWEKVN